MLTNSYRYSDFAEKYMTITVSTGEELMVRCLFHDESNGSMQFNVDKGLYVCFSCGAKGNIVSLQKHLGLRSIMETEVEVADILAKLDSLNDQAGKPKIDKLPVLDESYLDRWRFPTDYWGLCPDEDLPDGCIGMTGCKLHRGFTPRTIDAFDLGYDPMLNYATIPIRNVNGELLGVVKRYLDPDVEQRYRYPKGYKRSLHMFGSWLVEHAADVTEVTITEGSLDAAKLWQAGVPAVAQYGSSITRPQIRLLMRLGIQTVNLFYDNDKAGGRATEYALGTHYHRDRNTKEEFTAYDPSTDLSRYFNVRVTGYGDLKVKDPGCMTNRQIITSIARSTPVL